MAQIQSPETYVDGQQVTATRLNNQTNGAILLPGAVTDQTALVANTVASGDQVILHDASASAIRKATAADLVGSGLPIVTGAITGSTGADLVITPAAGQKVDVAGNLEADDINVTDDLTVGDDATVSGDLLVTGASTLTGNVIADNGFTSNGVANFAGTFQMGGTVGYALTEIVEETIPYVSTSLNYSAWTDLFTSASYTKPAGEIWVIEPVVQFRHSSEDIPILRLVRASDTSILDLKISMEGGGTAYWHFVKDRMSFVYDNASTFTSTFKIQGTVIPNQAGVTIWFSETGSWVFGGIVTHPAYKFRIYKYKTA